MDLSNTHFDLVGSLTGTQATNEAIARKVKPRVGESTGAQNPLSGLPLMWAGGGLNPATGTASTAFPFGGWNQFGSPFFPGISLSIAGTFFGWSGSFGVTQPRKGSYWTYRLMDLNPTLRLVRQLIIAPIMASQWAVRPAPWAQGMMPSKQKNAKRSDTPPWRRNIDPIKLENAVKLVSDQLLPARWEYLNEATRYLSFGWRGFEKVWEMRGGLYWFKRAKSLLPDWTQILHDGHGAFAGLSQSGIEGDALGPEKSFIVTYDGESGNLYGLPRHEAAYDTWTDWQSTRLREALYEGKMSGRLPKLHYRPGKTEMPAGSGEFVDNAAIAQQILTTVVEGRGVAIPDLQYEDAELINNPKLAGVSPWVLEFEDAGSNSEMLKGFQSIMEYKDKLLVRAWAWPERAVLEALHGSKADSTKHTDSAVIDRELIDDDLAQAISTNVADDIVTLNFGEEYRGAVEVKPAPLVDEKVAVYSDLLKAMAGNQAVAPELFAAIDIEEVCDHLDIEMSSSDLGERLKNLAMSLSDQRQNASKGAPQPSNNGKPRRPASAALLSRLGWDE